MRRKIETERVVLRFLFIPRIIRQEWRWLEFARIRQERVYSDKWKWVDKEWKN